jgi:hypothetical protein
VKVEGKSVRKEGDKMRNRRILPCPEKRLRVEIV